jgi:hypothetical protein
LGTRAVGVVAGTLSCKQISGSRINLKENKMATKKVSKLGDKLSKVNESININRYDNGFMVEVGGRDDENDWKTAKILCTTEEEMLAVVKEWNSMEIDT